MFPPTLDHREHANFHSGCQQGGAPSLPRTSVSSLVQVFTVTLLSFQESPLSMSLYTDVLTGLWWRNVAPSLPGSRLSPLWWWLAGQVGSISSLHLTPVSASQSSLPGPLVLTSTDISPGAAHVFLGYNLSPVCPITVPISSHCLNCLIPEKPRDDARWDALSQNSAGAKLAKSGARRRQ